MVWYDPATQRVKYGYHVQFDEGFNNLPLSKLPPNILLMDRHDKRVKPESITVTVPPFQMSIHPFFLEYDVTVDVQCDHPTFGFLLAQDDRLMRVYISGFAKNTKRPSKTYSCNTICASAKASVRKYKGAYITAINDEAVSLLEQALAKLAELQASKVTTFSMVLAREAKPSKHVTRRAYEELELPGFDIDESLGEDFFATDGDEHGVTSSISPSASGIKVSSKQSASTAEPTAGVRVSKEFKGGVHYQGTVVSGPYEIDQENGQSVLVWKVEYNDGDAEEMTASKIAHWRLPIQEVEATKPKSKVASKPSGDRAKDFHKESVPKPPSQHGAPTHRRRSTRLQQQKLEAARMHFLETNPYLPMDSISMYEAAQCRIHLCDDDPYQELLHNVDEVEMLLADPDIIAAIHRLLDPDLDLQEARVNALQSETITPEERALPRFSRNALKRLPTWDLWHKNELEQLDQMQDLGMFGAPQPLPEGGILMRFHWQYCIKVNGKQRSCLCCDGSPRAAPEVHSSTSTYASCLEHPIF